MKPLLALQHEAVFQRLAQGHALLAFDFDGTLAPLVRNRDAAQMRVRTASLLASVCALYPVAIISGRRREDLVGRLGRAQVKYAIGNHGAEWWSEAPARSRALSQAAEALARLAVPGAGLQVEDKGVSLSLHYRRAGDGERVAALVSKALSPWSAQLRLEGGKRVLNVLSRRAPRKGRALREALALVRATRGLYVGDDVTDEDALRLRTPGLVTVRVGRGADSQAEYAVPNQRAVDELLARLIATRLAFRGR